MIRLIFIALMYLVFAEPAFTQPVRVNLRVRTARDGQPVPGAVFRSPENAASVADEQGTIRLQRPSGALVEGTVSVLGFAPKDLRFSATRDTVVDVRLEETSYLMDDIRVEAERTGAARQAAARTEIDAHGLHEHAGLSLGEAVRDVPGVDLIAVGPGASKPVIRGLHSQRIRILNNGVAQEGQQWGGEHAPEIDPFAAARITVVKGAAGLEYGPGSIGGVVLVEPPEWRFAGPVQGRVATGVFSNNRQASGSIELDGAAGGAWSWRAQGSFRYAGDAAAPDYRITNSGFREHNVSGGAAWQRGNALLDVTASLFQTELGVYKGAHIGSTEDLLRAIERGRPLVETGFTYRIAPPKQQVRHLVFSSRYKWQRPDGAHLTARYGWQHNRRQEYDGHRRFSDVNRLKPAFDLTLSTYTAEAAWNGAPAGAFTWKTGGGLLRQENYRDGAFLIPGYSLYGGGGFVTAAWSGGAWGAEGGVRMDGQQLRIYPVRSRGITGQTQWFSSPSASVSVVRSLGGGASSLGITAGRTWRPPAINELYSDGVHHGTAQFEKGNAELTPEQSTALDLTWKHASALTHAEVSIYVNRMDGFIYAHPLGTPVLTIRGAFPSFEFRQTAARLAGAEMLLERRILTHWEIRMAGSYIHGQDLDNGRPLLFIPAPSAQMVLHYDNHLQPGGEWFAEARLRRVWRQTRFPAGIDYADPPPAYSLVSLTAGIEWPAGTRTVQLSLTADNLLNTRYRDYQSRYRYFIDEPGRNVLLRASIPI